MHQLLAQLDTHLRDVHHSHVCAHVRVVLSVQEIGVQLQAESRAARAFRPEASARRVVSHLGHRNRLQIVDSSAYIYTKSLPYGHASSGNFSSPT